MNLAKLVALSVVCTAIATTLAACCGTGDRSDEPEEDPMNFISTEMEKGTPQPTNFCTFYVYARNTHAKRKISAVVEVKVIYGPKPGDTYTKQVTPVVPPAQRQLAWSNTHKCDSSVTSRVVSAKWAN